MYNVFSVYFLRVIYYYIDIERVTKCCQYVLSFECPFRSSYSFLFFVYIQNYIVYNKIMNKIVKVIEAIRTEKVGTL